MSLGKMYDNKPMTNVEYEQAGIEIATTLDIPRAEIFWARLRLEVPANPVFLRLWKTYVDRAIHDELHALANLQEPSRVVMVQPGVPVTATTRQAVLANVRETMEAHPKTWYKTFRRRDMITFMCLFCGSTQGHHVLETVYTPPTGIFTFFDETLNTSQVITNFYRAHPEEVMGRYVSVAGLCTQCIRACIVCQRHMRLAPPTLEDLESFYAHKMCPTCTGGNITALSLPKPNSRDLKAFRQKLTRLHQES